MNLDLLLNKEEFNKEEIVFLLELEKEEDKQKLFNKADEIRKLYCDDEVHLRGVIEFSNYCSQHCMYCGLREENFSVKRYRMSAEEIIETAKHISNLGIRTVVLQSGEDGYYDTDMIAFIIYSIKQSTDVAVTLSLGERGFDEYKAWKIAGADRYLLKQESTNPKLYSIYHCSQSLFDRLNHINYLKSIGYQIGSGNIIGLPLQTVSDIVDDIISLKVFDVDMAAIGPFIPAEFTPYQNQKSAPVDLTLKAMAVARLVLKNVHIPSTTALDSLDELGREKGLSVGANVVMLNFTPFPYRGQYILHKNPKGIKEHPDIAYNKLRTRIQSMGRKLSNSKGHSYKASLTSN
ncbi:MAG: [FeFe] hydrogenase H-cluster radical SAM maturase HydE [Ignavibacteria bacterium]|jgi:biotin synthase